MSIQSSEGVPNSITESCAAEGILFYIERQWPAFIKCIALWRSLASPGATSCNGYQRDYVKKQFMLILAPAHWRITEFYRRAVLSELVFPRDSNGQPIHKPFDVFA